MDAGIGGGARGAHLGGTAQRRNVDLATGDAVERQARTFGPFLPVVRRDLATACVQAFDGEGPREVQQRVGEFFACVESPSHAQAHFVFRRINRGADDIGVGDAVVIIVGEADKDGRVEHLFQIGEGQHGIVLEGGESGGAHIAAPPMGFHGFGAYAALMASRMRYAAAGAMSFWS